MSETREQELARLIAEQARDDTPFQAPEPGVVPYGLLGDLVDGGERSQVRHLRRDNLDAGCTIHGRESLRVDPTRGTGFACRVCERERKARTRRDRAFTARKCGKRCAQSLERHPWHND